MRSEMIFLKMISHATSAMSPTISETNSSHVSFSNKSFLYRMKEKKNAQDVRSFLEFLPTCSDVLYFAVDD